MKTHLLPAGVLALAAFAFAQGGGDEPAPQPEPKKPKKPEKPGKAAKTAEDAGAPDGEGAPRPRPLALIKTSMGDIKVVLYVNEAPETVANFLGLATGEKEWVDPATKEKVTRPYFDGLIFHRCIKDFMIQGGCPKGDGSGSPGYKFDNEISARSLGIDGIDVIGENGQANPDALRLLQIRDREGFNRQVIAPLLRKWGVTSQEDLEQRQAEIQKKIKETLPKLSVADVYANLGFTFDNTRESHEPKRGCLAMANAGPGTNGSQFFINVIDTPWLAGKHTVFGGVVEGMDVVDRISNVKVGAGAKPVEDVKILSIRPVGFQEAGAGEAGDSEAPDEAGEGEETEEPAAPEEPEAPEDPEEAGDPEDAGDPEEGR